MYKSGQTATIYRHVSHLAYLPIDRQNAPLWGILFFVVEYPFITINLPSQFVSQGLHIYWFFQNSIKPLNHPTTEPQQRNNLANTIPQTTPIHFNVNMI